MKYERVYLKSYDTVDAARTDIADYVKWYNTHRPHFSVQGQTPEQTYYEGLKDIKQAA